MQVALMFSSCTFLDKCFLQFQKYLRAFLDSVFLLNAEPFDLAHYVLPNFLLSHKTYKIPLSQLPLRLGGTAS